MPVDYTVVEAITALAARVTALEKWLTSPGDPQAKTTAGLATTEWWAIRKPAGKLRAFRDGTPVLWSTENLCRIAVKRRQTPVRVRLEVLRD